MKKNFVLLAAGVLLAMAFTLSCSGDDGNDGGGGKSVDPNLVGKWEWSSTNISGSFEDLPNAIFTTGGYLFTSNSYTVYRDGVAGTTTTGAYTVNNELRSVDESGIESSGATYSISGTILTMTGSWITKANKVTAFSWE
jgi:hypothetical protein